MKRPCAEGPGRLNSSTAGKARLLTGGAERLVSVSQQKLVYMSAGQELNFLVVYRVGSVSVRLCYHVVRDYISDLSKR
jgi:hypothetical protein